MIKPYYYYWGKARASEGGPGYHLLPYHALDVVAVADLWLANSASLRNTFLESANTSNYDLLRAWLLFFVGLHDLGKLDVSFQLKAPDVAKSIWSEDLINNLNRTRPIKAFDHGQAGYAWFIKHLEHYPFLVQQEPDRVLEWMGAVAGHHGALIQNGVLKNFRAPELIKQKDWDARAAWIDDLSALFLLPNQAQQSELPGISIKLLAGFCSVCDWLGSGTDYFCYQDQIIDLPGYYEQSKQKALKALADSGLLSSKNQQAGMTLLYPEFSPKGLQCLIPDLPIQTGLTVIEAPTGSGKTEAALAYASYLLSQGLGDSLIFALPTQATANAMLSRLEKIAPKLFPQAGSNLLLAHGKARFNSAYKGLQLSGRQHTHQGKEEASVYCSQWLSSSRKRVFLGQIGVCTIDQVLLSVLPVRHHFVRAFGVQKSILIIDEVHAYDSYMNGLLDEVIRAQYKSGGSVILLSATLPSDRLRSLTCLWGNTDNQAEEQQPYPLITHVSERVEQWTCNSDDFQRTVALELKALSQTLPDLKLRRSIIAAAEKGARVAVICNLVADAQQLFQDLQQESDVPIDLFHSRFRFLDRQEIESSVIEQYGKDAERQSGRILIATQVIEQSLDLDFDWLITQLCPVDLLFQRIGRLHRHERSRPQGFEKPVCTILTSPQLNPQRPEYGLHELIYGNTRVLWRTEQLLIQNQEARFPACYRLWIEQVYNEEAWPGESEYLTEKYEAYWSEQYAKRSMARTISVSDTSPFRDTDANAAKLTRDGEMSLTLIPIQVINGQRLLLNQRSLEKLESWELDELLSLHTVPVPDSWSKTLPAAEEGVYFLPLTPHGEIWSAELEKANYRYDLKMGMERKLHESTH